MSETSAQQNLETVRGVYDAYEARDVDGLLGSLHDEFEVTQSEQLPWGGAYKGRDGMMAYIQAISTYVDSGVVVEKMFEAGEHVIVTGRATGTVRANGKSYEVALADVCQVRDGKLLRLDIYIDTPAVLEVLGQ